MTQDNILHLINQFKLGYMTANEVAIELGKDHKKALNLAVIEALINELTLQNSWYDLKGGHVLMYYRDGKPIYVGERIEELKKQQQALTGEGE